MESMKRAEMKAKLSDRTERCWSYYDGDQGAGAALAEAREILGETERETGGPHVLPCYIPPRLLGGMPGRALAEALAAFVGGF